MQAGFETPPAVRYTFVIMEKCVSPEGFTIKSTVQTKHTLLSIIALMQKLCK